MKLSKILLATLLALPLSGFAATDGPLGATSDGIIGISLSTTKLVKISGLTDINIIDDTSSASGYTNACVFANGTGSSPDFNIKASSSEGGAGAFKLKNSNSDELDYIPTFYSASDKGGIATILTNTDQSVSLLTGNKSREDCSNISGGVNASIGVATDASVAVADTLYVDDLTVTLTTI